MKFQKLILGMLLSLFIVSCSKDDASSNSDLSDAKANTKMDAVTDDIAKVIDDQFSTQFGPSGKSSEIVQTFLPEL